MAEPLNGFEFLEQLRKKNGKRFQRTKDLHHFLDIKAREKGIPISVQFELTPLCNFSCKMCYVHLNPDQLNGRDILPAETWKDLMHQAWEAGMIQATLTGGECLAYPGFDELFLYLHSLGCSVAVLTNGYLLDDDRIRFFQEHTPNIIQVTLYGQNDDVYERVTGRRAFTTVAENVRKAIEAKLPVSLNITPNNFLGEDVLDTVRFAKTLRSEVTINSAIFSPNEETGRAAQKDDPETELYVRIYRLLDELDGRETKEFTGELPPVGGPSHACSECGLKCGSGRSTYTLNWKGTMLACNRMDMIHADALQEGIPKAWARVCREANNWPRIPECEGCAYYDVCNNCMANMLRFAEPGKQPKPLCEQTKYFVSHGVRHIPECD